MAKPRLPVPLRGAPSRFAAVLLVGAAVAGGVWGHTAWRSDRGGETPASFALAGKQPDRLFSGDETEIPVREARIYDTIAMFSQPQAEARPWSQAPVSATAQEAGIRPAVLRPVAMPKLAAAEPSRKAPDTAAAKPQRVAALESAARGARAKAEASEPVRLLGWSVPGSQHLPSRKDAGRALDKVGDGAAAVGSGTVKVVSRTASALGNGVASAGNAIASTFGFN